MTRDVVRVIVCTGASSPDPWVRDLAGFLPGHEVLAWSPDDPVQADYVATWGPPPALFDTQRRLKAIMNLGAGVDSLLKIPNLPDNVPVFRLEDGGMAEQMSDYVSHAVIGFSRQYDAYRADTRNGIWKLYKPALRDAYPVGVMGLGVLGAHVAGALAAQGFPVFGWSRTPKNLDGVNCLSGEAALGTFLRSVRILVCLLPLTPETENILNLELLGKLKPDGWVINVARGAHLVDEDLIALLDNGHLAGATLDVFRVEPLPAGHPFWRHPKITLTPHISARTLRNISLQQVAQNILKLERGEAVTGVVDRKRGY